MRSGVAGKGNLLRVAHLTGNFTSEAPLSQGVLAAITAAFDQGWADPKKLSQASHQARTLRASALEELAQSLTCPPSSLEVLGEPSLLHHLSLGGFTQRRTHLYTSAIDVGRIRAVARAHSGPSTTMAVDSAGAISLPGSTSDSVISLQARNGETGIAQELEPWRSLPGVKVLDATRAIPTPGMTTGFAAATFDAATWGGPMGLGFLQINEGETFRYPLAHIAPIRVPGSYSLPLLVGSVIALNEFREEERAILEKRSELAVKLSAINGVEIIGQIDEGSRQLSLIVSEISGEEVLRALIAKGFHCDAGSACSPEDLTPSHVIAAMGYPTSGHMRVTVHATTTGGDIAAFAQALESVLTELRS